MSNINHDGKLWMMRELYGVDALPPAGDYETIVKATLICAKGDGVLAPEERSWIVGRAAALRSPAYELAKTYPGDDDLLEVLSASSTPNEHGRKMVIYLAIQACAADGEYHPDERARVHAIARVLGVEAGTVEAIERQCAEEAALRAKRIALLFPEGDPYSGLSALTSE